MHMPVKGEGKDHVCVVCSETHNRYKHIHPGTTYTNNPHKKVKTSFKWTGCDIYLCIKEQVAFYLSRQEDGSIHHEDIKASEIDKFVVVLEMHHTSLFDDATYITR